MKLAKLSLAAILALGASAYALEDIKVSGGVKVWYETDSKGNGTNRDLFDRNAASADVAFNLKATGKQGNVGFGVNVYQDNSMGLVGEVVSGARSKTEDGDMFVGELYITAPVLPNTVMKLGKQELNTPLAFTEKWNSVPNTFNAAVLINNSIKDVTLIGAYVGQSNSHYANNYATATGADSWQVAADGQFATFHGGAYAFGAMTKISNVDVAAWYYHLNEVASTLGSATAYWVDLSTKIANFNVKGTVAGISSVSGADSSTDAYKSNNAYALSASTKVSDFTLSAAYSKVGDDASLPFGNTATGFKKTKLPTAGVYTDGLYVAQPDSQAFKLKAATKMAGYGLTLQYVDNSNDTTASKETSEIDLIVSKKFGDTNVKAIILDRDFDQKAAEDAAGGAYVRIIASWAF